MSLDQQPTLKPLTIATLGSSESGKTTLISAITRHLAKLGQAQALDPDQINAAPSGFINGIPVCRAEIAFTSGRSRYIQNDFPTHHDCVIAMLAGNLHFDFAILVVSALDGPLPHTRTQLLIAKAIGIKNLIVYLNKCDQVDDEDAISLFDEEIRSLLTSLGFRGEQTRIITGSALKASVGEDDERGYGSKSIQDLLDFLSQEIATVMIPAEKAFLLPVESVATMTGRGTFVTGCIETGRVSVGDEIELVGMGTCRKVVVDGIGVMNQKFPKAEAGDQVTLLLRSISKEGIERGMVLAKTGRAIQAGKFRAVFYLLKKEEGGRPTPFTNHYKPQFWVRTADMTGDLSQLESADTCQPIEMAYPGDVIRATIQLIKPLALDEHFTVTMVEGGKKIGVGVITEVLR